MDVLKFLSSIQKKTSHQKDAFEKGLMFVDAIINSKPAKSTMVDSCATHNFISEHEEASQLELRIKKNTRKMKAVNSKVFLIVGVLKRISLKLAEWREDVGLVVVHMEDFGTTLSMEFFLQHKVISMPLTHGMVVTSNNLTVVQSKIKQPSGVRMISALQLKKGLNREEQTFMLPKSLPSQWEIDNEIKLVLGTKPPAKNAYGMAPPELAELKKQLDELLAARFIRPEKAPNEAPVLFENWFIEGFSRRVAPLTEVLKKDKTWKWPIECQTSFNELKVTMISRPVLELVEVSKPFVVEIDASDFALGVVLTQAKMYTKTRLIYQKDKVEKAKVVGLLKPLPIPTRLWDSVSMDFIVHLLKVGDPEAILGVPMSIVNDRDGRFIGLEQVIYLLGNEPEHFLKLPPSDLWPDRVTQLCAQGISVSFC
ncbi:uncharacterized protein E5676_scaffold313G002590 [Cucumis melo var. makuwa]|uniref:Reverse transcriptase/retrotransposon-derived protein RNase H-like domain-containing protein n=1 Tax=Cucumis melo var. makuwa TaxID=1194695 RepID=A0A5A7V9H9_CUCMM|nr:uncharacterized protein E6C27_scaffold154G001260 [Cucumis melo var. makuwa]TYK26619.1 uncharacterized protein E5676_scaffold313G002590 [Cucumis melo var. makuwa]